MDFFLATQPPIFCNYFYLFFNIQIDHYSNNFIFSDKSPPKPSACSYQETCPAPCDQHPRADSLRLFSVVDSMFLKTCISFLDLFICFSGTHLPVASWRPAVDVLCGWKRSVLTLSDTLPWCRILGWKQISFGLWRHSPVVYSF